MDPSGLVSAAVLGTFIHQDIRDNKYPGVNLIKKIPQTPLSPDIADILTKEVYEIKPYSDYGADTCFVDVEGYSLALNHFAGPGWHPGTNWFPPFGPHIEPVTGTPYIIVRPFIGCIFYWVPSRPIKERVWVKIKENARDLETRWLPRAYLDSIVLNDELVRNTTIALALATATSILITAAMDLRATFGSFA